MIRSLPVLICALALAFPSLLRAHEIANDMSAAAASWLNSLSPELRQKAVYELKSDERLNWHFIPKTRNGVTFAEQTEAQRKGVHRLLQTALSERGYLQATTIVSLESILKEIEQGKGPVRDGELYYLTLFGKPEAGQTWGWRFEGHHLSLNFCIIKGHEVTVAPAFLGSNPAEIRTGNRKGQRTLAREEDLGRALVRSLDDAQRKKAVFSENAPADIITGAAREARRLEDGLHYQEMKPEQQRQLVELLEVYVRRYRAELADEDLRRIRKAGIDKISFSWGGGSDPGQGHYYRVQGPTFLLEYDNTQNQANHIHTVWRDYERDFGGDLLKEHYATSPH